MSSQQRYPIRAAELPSARPLSAAQEQKDLLPPATHRSVPADGKRGAA